MRLGGPVVTAAGTRRRRRGVIPRPRCALDTPGHLRELGTPLAVLAIGAAVGERVGDATVKAPPEIGTVAYACDCSVVDVFPTRAITLPSIERTGSPKPDR